MSDERTMIDGEGEELRKSKVNESRGVKHSLRRVKECDLPMQDWDERIDEKIRK